MESDGMSEKKTANTPELVAYIRCDYSPQIYELTIKNEHDLVLATVCSKSIHDIYQRIEQEAINKIIWE